MTSSDLAWTVIDQELVDTHKASGKPRYSIYLSLVGGGFVRRWTDDRSEALSRHVAAVAEPRMDMVVTLDHWRVEAERVEIRHTSKTAAQLKAESDAAIDRMIDRFLDQETG